MKKKIALISIVMLTIISLATCVQAYQSTSKGSSNSAEAAVWIKGIRQMEEIGGGLGLAERIDETTLLAETESNNIDVHLAKNTEYGAALLLGASDYGKQGTDIEARRMNKGETTVLTGVQASTTGNRYGVYEIGYYDMNTARSNDEWVAGGTTTFLSDKFPSLASRYIDRYENDTAEKAGDATIETKNWHKASYANFVVGSSGIGRGDGGAFSYDSNYSNSSFFARAGVVVGVGL